MAKVDLPREKVRCSNRVKIKGYDVCGWEGDLYRDCIVVPEGERDSKDNVRVWWEYYCPECQSLIRRVGD